MIQDGDTVILFEPESGRRWLVNVVAGAIKQRGLGVFDPGRFIDMEPGSPVQVAGKDLVLFEPRLPDIVSTLRRKAAIINAKDSGRIVHELGLRAGDVVFESGIGSGATTAAFANAVGNDGRVVVQELREDFQEWAMKNMVAAGFGDRVTCCIGDLTEAMAPEAVEAGPFDAALLDQPMPWDAIPNLEEHLRPGATVVCYCPQVSQMEKVVEAMTNFVDVRCIELIEREWLVKEHGSRPDHNGLMHTAFLVMGRYVKPIQALQ